MKTTLFNGVLNLFEKQKLSYFINYFEYCQQNVQFIHKIFHISNISTHLYLKQNYTIINPSLPTI